MLEREPVPSGGSGGRRRMRLVVVATVLAMATVGGGCRCDCYPKAVSIPVESCGSTRLVPTTVCEGLCFHKDSVLVSPENPPEQKICTGDWFYEVKHFEDCDVAVSYPVARSCTCASCNTLSTDCGRVQRDVC
ncbi:gonadotropin subunit beta-1-like [Menidia menidia]